MSRLKQIIKSWIPMRWANANYDDKLDPRIKEMLGKPTTNRKDKE